MLVKNINACDEIWIVSEGSGENLRSLGYTGEFFLMGNGVDFPRAKAAPERIEELRQLHGLTADIPVFLFVGRMEWYKGLRIILDGLKKVAQQGMAFKMIFIGDGGDYNEVKDYTSTLGLSDCCIFTGAIRDRELLRVYYSMSDMFLFPSTFDNRPIVLLEAAACGLAGVLIRGSSSAEGVTDGRQAMLIEENADDLARAVTQIIKDRSLAKTMGQYAMDELYISWEDAVTRAYDRYFTVIENYKSKNSKRRHNRISIISSHK
jgi:glycosyltransferase involved in cell wall biosynthesis